MGLRDDADDEDVFLRLGDLISRADVSVGKLATAIEVKGIEGWDRFGRFKTFGTDAPETTAVLNVLAEQHAWMMHLRHDPVQEPLGRWRDVVSLSWDAFDCGWRTSSLPEFDLIAESEVADPPPRRMSGGKAKGDNATLIVIAALLSAIYGKHGAQAHPQFKSQAELIRWIEKQFGSLNGAGERSLKGKFPLAEQHLSDALNELEM